MKNWFVICACALLFSACASPSVSNKPLPPSATETEYTIGVGDQVSVQVWKSPELSLSVPVRPDGKISVPLIGDVIAAGETTRKLSATLSQGFSEYVRNAQVTVIVLNPSSGEYLRRVRVTGAVTSPISLPHQQGITVLDLVLEAGGPTEFANGNKSKLFRKVGDKMEVYPIFLNDILQKGRLETNYFLAPSDVVTVPERSF
ncbi:MAG: polysaccharide biosynthesis/export family protein [Cellvibrionaceae bacterium]|nr:polysaccharide biosynthesis/export family protein [Cellvibrionaceae bacterium]